MRGESGWMLGKLHIVYFSSLSEVNGLHSQFSSCLTCLQITDILCCDFLIHNSCQAQWVVVEKLH